MNQQERMRVQDFMVEFTTYLDQQLATWRAHGPGNEGCSPHVANEVESIRTFWLNQCSAFIAAAPARCTVGPVERGG